MRGLIVLFLVLFARASLAGDLEALKSAAERYVAAMKVVLEAGENPSCYTTGKNASAYAVAKVAYYNAARQAMSALL
jgi:hypothetical protein